MDDDLIKVKEIEVDETGLFGKGKLVKLESRGEVKILEFTEEGIKGIIKIDSDVFKYEGESLNALLHGKGKFKNDYLLYEGEFKNNLFNGYGELTVDNELY